jgi:glucose/arabinose dehydrogenase
MGAALAAVPAARAQSCAMPPESEFKTVEIIPQKTMSNPSHMAVLGNGEIFAIEQWSGKLWHYTPGKATELAGTVPTNAGLQVEDGMLGIVADLDYAKTRWLYIYHTPAVMGTTRISRYTVGADGKIANPKIIIELPRTRVGGGHDERHAGGGMEWNARTGDLYLSVGDDTYPFGDRSIYGPRDPDNAYSNALRTAANTNDLRGKVLRIRPIAFPDAQTPTPGVGTTYSIPAGNLFPAGKYPADKTRPEILTMGTRNAYRVKVDTLTGWAFTGEVGADAQTYDSLKGPPGYDHIYLIKGPANFGWPFDNGNMEPYIVRDYEKDYLAAGLKAGQPFDLKNLKNRSAYNTGLVDLPPASAPLIWYCANAYQKGLPAKLGGGAETVMIGPTYDFNPALNSAVKLPPYFHRKVIFGDYSRHYLWLMTLDTAGTLTNLERIKTGVTMTDLHLGPDGTLYILDYAGGGVLSLQYTGAQKDYKACGFIKEGCTNSRFAEYDRTANLNRPGACATPVALRPGAAPAPERLLPGLAPYARRIRLPAGATGAEAFDVHGKRVAFARGRAGELVELRGGPAAGVLRVRFTRD